MSDNYLKERIKKLFIKFDLNKDGYLKANEIDIYINEVFKNEKVHSKKEDIKKRIFDTYDINNDEKISLDEFIDFFL